MLVVTHSGRFHADDVLGYAILRAALGEQFAFRRSRDPGVIAAADLAFDVGGGPYDHHMRDGGERRTDGTPYSAAGLLWRDFGRQALATWLPVGADAAILGRVWRMLDETLIVAIDRIDNGCEAARPDSVARMLGAFNPPWNADQSADACFADAAVMAATWIRRAAEQACATASAEALVLAAIQPDTPKIIELPAPMPWIDAAHTHCLPVLYALYPERAPPDGSCSWIIATMPTEPGGLLPRQPLPECWAGLADDRLRTVTGVADAVFCHRNRFLAVASSRSGAYQLIAAAQAASDGAMEGDRSL